MEHVKTFGLSKTIREKAWGTFGAHQHRNSCLPGEVFQPSRRTKLGQNPVYQSKHLPNPSVCSRYYKSMGSRTYLAFRSYSRKSAPPEPWSSLVPSFHFRDPQSSQNNCATTRVASKSTPSTVHVRELNAQNFMFSKTQGKLSQPPVVLREHFVSPPCP